MCRSFSLSQLALHCRIRRAIIDKGVDIPAGTEIGYDIGKDRERFWVSPQGIVVISKEEHIDAPMPLDPEYAE